MVFSACCNESDNMPSSSEVKKESMGLVSDPLKKRPYPKFSVINNARETDILTSNSQERLGGLVFDLTKLPFARRNGTAQARESVENLETKEVYTSRSSSGFSSKDSSLGYSSSGSSSSGSPSPASTTTVPEAQTQQVSLPPLSPVPNLTGCKIRRRPTLSPQNTNNENTSSQSSDTVADTSWKLEQYFRIFIKTATSSLHEQCETTAQLDLKNLSVEVLERMAKKIARRYNDVVSHYTILKLRGYYRKDDFITLTELHIMTKGYLTSMMDAGERCMHALGQNSSSTLTLLMFPPSPPSPTGESIQEEKNAFTPIVTSFEQTVSPSSSSGCVLIQGEKSFALPTGILSEQVISSPSPLSLNSEETFEDHSMQSSSSSMPLHPGTSTIRSPQPTNMPFKLQNLTDTREVEQVENEPRYKQGEKFQVGDHVGINVKRENVMLNSFKGSLSSVPDCDSCVDSFVLDKEEKLVFSVPYLHSSNTRTTGSVGQSHSISSPVSMQSDLPNSAKRQTLSEQISSMLRIPSPTRLPENRLALVSPKHNTGASLVSDIVDPSMRMIEQGCPHSQSSPRADVPKWDIEKNTETFFFGLLYFSPTVTMSSSGTVTNKKGRLSTTMIANSSLTLKSSSMCPPTSEYAHSHSFFKEHCETTNGNTFVVNCSDALLTPPITPSNKYIDPVFSKQPQHEQVTPPVTPDAPIMTQLPTSYTIDKHIALPGLRPQNKLRTHTSSSIVRVLQFESFENTIPSIQEEISPIDLCSSTSKTIANELPVPKEVSQNDLSSSTTSAIMKVDLLDSLCDLSMLPEKAVLDKDNLLVSSFHKENTTKGSLVFPPSLPSQTVAQNSASHLGFVEVNLRVNSRGEREGVGSFCCRVSPQLTSTEVNSSAADCVLETKIISKNPHPEESSDSVSQITGRNIFENDFEIQQCCSREKCNRTETIGDIFAIENNMDCNDDLENSLSCSSDRVLREILLRRKIEKRKWNLQQRKKEFFETELNKLKDDQLLRWISQSRILYNNTDQLFDELEKLEIYNVKDCELRLELEQDSLEVLNNLVKARETKCDLQPLTSSKVENNRTSTLLDPIDFTQFATPQLGLSSPLECVFDKANCEPSFLISNGSSCSEVLNTSVNSKNLVLSSPSRSQAFTKELDFFQEEMVSKKPETTLATDFVLVSNTLLLTKLFINSLQEVLSFTAMVILKTVSEVNETTPIKQVLQKDSVSDPSPTKTEKSHQTQSSSSGSTDRKKPDLKNPIVRRRVIAEIVSLLHFQRVNNVVLKNDLHSKAMTCPQHIRQRPFKTSSRKSRSKKSSSTRKSSSDQVPISPLTSGYSSSSEKFSVRNSSLKKQSGPASLPDCFSRKPPLRQRPNKFQTQRNLGHTMPSKKSILKKGPSEIHSPSGKAQGRKSFHNHCTRKNPLRTPSATKSTYPPGSDQLSDPRIRKDTAQDIARYLIAIHYRNRAKQQRRNKIDPSLGLGPIISSSDVLR